MSNKILIVDDEAHMRELLKYNFAKEGFEVDAAADGLEGLERAKTGKPDIIISDIMMPKMDGIEFCRTLRKDPDLNSIPFIFLTAKGQLSDKIAGLKTGADDYLTKPFIPKELIEMVNTRLKRAKVYKEISDVDELTGVFNRKYFKEKLAADVFKAGRLGIPLILGFIDIDTFGKANDACGHPVGDMILKEIAAIIKKRVPGEDILCRYGGEEFVVIMPAKSETDAIKLMDEVRADIEQARFNPEGKNLDIKFTVSIGVSVYPRDASDADSLVTAADKALYAAKKAGRNMVVSSGGMKA